MKMIGMNLKMLKKVKMLGKMKIGDGDDGDGTEDDREEYEDA